MKDILVDTRYLLVTTRYPSWRRKYRFRHNKGAKNFYFQFYSLEIVLWYG